MDIIFSPNNNEQVLTLPILPENPELVQSYKNSTFERINGKLNLIGIKVLGTVSFSSFLPNKKYKFIRPKASKNGW